MLREPAIMKHILVAAMSAFALAACSPQTGDAPMPDAKAPISYAASGWTAKPLPDLAEALQTGEITAEALTQAYLDRIELVDRNGPPLQAVLTLNRAATPRSSRGCAPKVRSSLARPISANGQISAPTAR